MRDKRIAIVGAGAFGSWIALLAARAGFETTFVDQYGPANERSSSAGPSRIIRRAYGADEIYTLFAERSRKLWTTFFAAGRRSDCFRTTGVLWMANGSDPSIHAARAIFERHHLPHEFLASPSIRALFPAINVPDGTVAIFEPDCGALLADQSIRAVAESAIRNGARYIEARVEAPRDAEPVRFLKLENNEPVEADVFVFACGSWLPKLFPEVLGSAIFPTRQEVFFFDPPPEWAQSQTASPPVWVDQTDPRIPYGFPDIDGAGVKIAFHHLGPPFDPDSGNRGIDKHHIEQAAEYLQSRFPSNHPPVFRRAQVCHYENSSTGDFLIDRHPAIPNVWFAGGGSGHGFKHGPAVAEYLLDAIQANHSPEPRFQLAGKAKHLAKRVV